MRRPGQPLRFLGWIVGGWIAMRVLVLLSAAAPFMGTATEQVRPVLARREEPLPSGEKPDVMQSSQIAPGSEAMGRMLARRFAGVNHPDIPLVQRKISDEKLARSRAERTDDTGWVAGRASATYRQGEQAPAAGKDGQPHRIPSPPGKERHEGRRWSGTAWMLWRPDVAGGLAQAPLLGGSQAGARIDYRVAESGLGRIGVYGRVSRALSGAPSEEAALGVALRPGHAPVSVLAERRQRLGRGGRDGFALFVAGGINPRELAPRLVAEGYAQAGLVGLPGLDGFADGKASLGYRLSSSRSPSRLTLGASLSGGVQPGAGRLDIGPELGLRLPASATALRLSLEWRERVLGDARPARGPTITLVSDF